MKKIIFILLGFTLISCDQQQSANYSTWIEMERCTSHLHRLVFEDGGSRTVAECTNWETYLVRRRN